MGGPDRFDLAQHLVPSLGGILYAAQQVRHVREWRHREPMTTIRDFNASIHAIDEWIDDLMRRLGWHDRERACLALVAALHDCATSCRGTRQSTSARKCRPCCAVFTTKDGIQVHAERPKAAMPSWGGFTTAYTAILRSMRNRSPAPHLHFLQHACPRRNWRMPKPQRQKPCTTFGPAENARSG